MTGSPPVTRFIGEAERTLQALLQRQLQKADMSFPEWIALAILSGDNCQRKDCPSDRRCARGGSRQRNEPCKWPHREKTCSEWPDPFA
jgi:hypothetical protein